MTQSTELGREEESERPELTMNGQTQTPFSRQVGNNQPPLPDIGNESDGESDSGGDQ